MAKISAEPSSQFYEFDGSEIMIRFHAGNQFYITRAEASELIRQLQTALLELDDIGIPHDQVVS